MFRSGWSLRFRFCWNPAGLFPLPARPARRPWQVPLVVHREALFEAAYTQSMKSSPEELRKRLVLTFAGEEAVDEEVLDDDEVPRWATRGGAMSRWVAAQWSNGHFGC